MRRASVFLVLALVGCHHDHLAPHPHPHGHGPVVRKGNVTLTVVGTEDLHGALDRLPILAGYLADLRATRAADGGAVLLLDAGDMFQGTLESNGNEGAAVIEAYNALGYTAVTLGNHEFDFGPPGPATTAQTEDDDPRGALKARAAEAKFPVLTANIADAETGERIQWPNMPPSTIVDEAGVKVGLVGVATEATPYTTMPANFKGLKMIPPADAIVAEAKKLRAQGAQVVIALAHLGSKCTDTSNPDDLTSCDQTDEVFKVANAIPTGLVDVIVAGHTHAAVAHRINGIAVIEAYSSGRAFGRVDLRVNAEGRVVASTIRQPQDLCPLGADKNPVPAASCDPAPYEGKPVVKDAAVQAIADRALDTAKQVKEQPLGVTLTAAFPKDYGAESAEGDLFTDLMLEVHPDADVALTNGGGLRADLPAGALTYGALYEAMPFDNHFAMVTMQGKHLRRLVANNLAGSSGIFSWAGVTVDAACKAGELVVRLRDRKGKVIDDDRNLTVATSDFLASGGDGAIGHLELPDGAIDLSDVVIRDAIADDLRARKKKELSPEQFFDAKKPRMRFPGKRPVSCETKPKATK